VNVCDAPSAGSEAKFYGSQLEALRAERGVPALAAAGPAGFGAGNEPAPGPQPKNAAVIPSATLMDTDLVRDKLAPPARSMRHLLRSTTVFTIGRSAPSIQPRCRAGQAVRTVNVLAVTFFDAT
jgi:hypothetical protein